MWRRGVDAIPSTTKCGDLRNELLTISGDQASRRYEEYCEKKELDDAIRARTSRKRLRLSANRFTEAVAAASE